MKIVKDLANWIGDLENVNVEAIEDDEVFFYKGVFLKVYECGWIDKDLGIRWKKPIPGIVVIHADDIDKYIIEIVEKWIEMEECNLPENEWYEVEVIRRESPRVILLL